jgi:hypothetical protein
LFVGQKHVSVYAQIDTSYAQHSSEKKIGVQYVGLDLGLLKPQAPPCSRGSAARSI